MNNGNKDRDRHSETMIFRPGELSAQAHQKQAVLTVIRGNRADLGHSKPIGQEILVGRARECGLVLADMMVSSRHARLTRQADGRYVLEDLGSTNGTRVNGQPLAGAWKLGEGDKIYLGEAVLRFSMVDAMDLGYHEELSQLARVDPLTGLDSKRCFDDALAIALQHALQQGQPLSVLMMDMDGIKPINDTHGHLFGEYAIAQTGRLIARVLGEQGRACRFGGDEFTAMLPGFDKAAAVQVAEDIRRLLQEAGLEKNGIPLQPTISIGVASCPEDGDTLLALVDAADQALYRSKRAGKNRVSV